MEAKMEKIETNVVKLEVKVEAAQFNEAINKSYKKNVKHFNIPGFRKGKVPMAMVKKQYGVEVLLDEAQNIAIDETYTKVLIDNNVTPVDRPQVDVVQCEEGKDFIYTITVTTYPEVTLGEYKGLGIEAKTYEVTEEEVNARLDQMRAQNARVESKEDGEVAKGDIAVIDFKGFIGEEAFAGGEGTDYSLEIGSGSFIDNFEDQLIGAKVGEQVEVNVTFPEQYGKDELNGKAARFEVTVKEIKVKELPELDDEFAKETSEFDTLAEVKEDIKKNIEEQNVSKAKTEFEDAVISAVVDNAKMEVPEVMIQSEIDTMVKNLESRLSQQGLTLEQYFQFTGQDANKVREYMKETADKKVKTDLVLEAVEKAEKIEASEEEIRTRAEEVAKMYAAENAEMVDLLIQNQKHALIADVKANKTVEFLLENNK